MFAKVLVIVAIVAYVRAQGGAGVGGGDHHHAYSYASSTLHNGEEHEVVYHDHPKYEYKYGVEDPHTHDQKTKHETRDGEHTQGEYSVVEPDGTILTVHYSVAGKSGYNAVVHRTGHAAHPQPIYHHH